MRERGFLGKRRRRSGRLQWLEEEDTTNQAGDMLMTDTHTHKRRSDQTAGGQMAGALPWGEK
jgi:hypothetical protein